MVRLADALRKVAGGLLLLTVVASPWVFAGIPSGSLRVLHGGVAAAAAAWLLSLLLALRRPGIPPIVGLAALWIVCQGWIMALNPVGTYDPATQTLRAIDPAVRWLPGAVEGVVAAAAATHATLLLGALLVAIDLCACPRWRARFVIAVAADATAVAAAGLLGKAGVLDFASLMPERPASSVFATFDYHGSAAAYLNVAAPLLLAACVAPGRGGPTTRTPGAAGLACVTAGIAVNLARQGPLVLLVVLPTTWLLWAARRAPSRRRGTIAVAVVVAVVAALGVSAVAATPTLRDRWSRLPDTVESRVLRWRIAAHMWLDAPLVGLGPGTFKVAFPISEHFIFDLYSKSITKPHDPRDEVETWDHAHQDYLQSLVEWGLVGTVAWATPLAAAIIAGWRRLRLAGDPWAAALLGSLLAAGLHGLGDYPMQVPAIALTIAALAGVMIGGRIRGDAPGEGRNVAPGREALERVERPLEVAQHVVEDRGLAR